MTYENDFLDAWNQLPLGASNAFAQQWMGLVAGGLPCGSSIVDEQGQLVAAGRNHVYDLPEKTTHSTSLLQYTRVAHAEINALASVPTNIEPHHLTLWTTQHPCIMCAAAIRFIGVGKVYYIADDPSDDSPISERNTSRGTVPYEALGNTLWWTVSNLLFLYNSVVKQGDNAPNIHKNRERYPALVRLVLQLAADDQLRKSAPVGTELPQAMLPYAEAIFEVVS